MEATHYLRGFLEGPRPVGVASLGNPSELHLTVLAAFTLPCSSLRSFTRDVAAVVSYFPPPTVEVAAAEARPGTPPATAWPVEATDRVFTLGRLHRTLLGVASHAGARLREPQHAGDAYRPHVSHLEATEPFTLTHLTFSRLLDSRSLVHLENFPFQGVGAAPQPLAPALASAP